MRIVWDEPKRLKDIEDHGLDFLETVDFEWPDAVVRATHPSSTGRSRFVAIGLLRGDLFAVVFSFLGTEGISIVSFRRASRRERRTYEDETG